MRSSGASRRRTRDPANGDTRGLQIVDRELSRLAQQHESASGKFAGHLELMVVDVLSSRCSAWDDDRPNSELQGPEQGAHAGVGDEGIALDDKPIEGAGIDLGIRLSRQVVSVSDAQLPGDVVGIP
jgi:hypothetical protein